jgi:AcrR family transcriptional regulator
MAPADRILREARKIYERHGLPGLSIRRVSARVGVTPMALYRHYAGKDALLDALVAEGFAEWETYVARAADEPTPMARVRAILAVYVEFALDHPRLFELMFLTPRKGIPPAPASLESPPSPGFTRIIAAFNEAMRERSLATDDTKEVILMAWATVHGLIALHFSGRFQFDDAAFRQIAARQIDRLIRALAPARKPSRK